jgi:pimeloyl-ACP methyl ester carboxylesterase
MADLVEKQGIDALIESLRSRPIPSSFAGLESVEYSPDVKEHLLPSILRGAALSDLPEASIIAQLKIPVLILAWTDDPGHPVSSAKKLHELIQGSHISIAESLNQIGAWGKLAAEFLET